MAVSFVKSGETVFGDKRCVYGVVTLGGQASGAVATTLEVIDGGYLTNKSCVSGGYNAAFNADSAGAAANGYLQIKSGDTGNDYYVFLYGR